MKNVGKQFEQSFSNSAPTNVCVLRIPDSANSFYHSPNLRFSSKAPFDYLMWYPEGLTLYALELKTVKGKTISFERTKEDSGEIHYHQIQALEKFHNVGGVVSGLVIEFREIETTIFLPVTEFTKLSNQIPKKSFNFSDLETYGIKYIKIEQTLKKKYYSYDIESFINQTALHKSDGGKTNEV